MARSVAFARCTCAALSVLLALPAVPHAQARRDRSARQQRLREPLTPANPQLMRELLKQSEQWVKAADKDEDRLRKEQREATKDAIDGRRGTPALHRAHEAHRKSLYTAGSSLRFEKDFSLELQRAAKSELPDGTRLRLEAARVSSRIQRYQQETERGLAFAESASAAADEKEVRELYTATAVNYQRSADYLERWRDRYDAYLAAAGVQSTNAFLARQAERLARAREAAARKKLDDEKKGELLAALLLGLLVASAVAQANAGPSTPEQNALAKERAFQEKQLRDFGCQLGITMCM